MNATSEPCAPCRGASSMSRTPRAFSCASAARMSSTRSVMWCRPGPALLHVLRDRRVVRGGLEQLERGLARRDEVRAHALRRDLFGRLDLEPERVAVERQRRVEVRHRDADVIERSAFRGFTRFSRLSALLGSGCRRRPCTGSTSRAAIRSSTCSNSPASSTRRSTCCMNRCARSSRSRHSARARRRVPCADCDVRAEPLDGVEQLGDALAGRRLGLEDRRPPLAGRERLQRQHRPRSTATVRSAPSRSALLTTKMSAISMMPALSACTSSPAAGHEHHDRDVGGADDVDFVLADADGLDDDDVLAGGVEHERGVARRRARPPRWPRVAMLRMNTPASPACACMRTRSPRIAPPVNGLVGSTATTPTVRPVARIAVVSDRRACSCRRPAGR